MINSGGNRKITKDDLNLWLEAVSDPSALVSSAEINKKSLKSNSSTSQIMRRATSFSSRAIDRNTARAIRKGKLPIEDKIDLHGKTLEEARADLTRFLMQSSDKGLKCVLAITGKGGRFVSDPNSSFTIRGTGVIKAQLPTWLESKELSHVVIGSTTASQRDGGDGARYILLRKVRY